MINRRGWYGARRTTRESAGDKKFAVESTEERQAASTRRQTYRSRISSISSTHAMPLALAIFLSRPLIRLRTACV